VLSGVDLSDAVFVYARITVNDQSPRSWLARGCVI
jgi:hypothetical protein